MGEVLNGEGEGVEGDFVEEHAYFPEIDELRSGGERGVELLGGEVVGVGVVGQDAEEGVDQDVV